MKTKYGSDDLEMAKPQSSIFPITVTFFIYAMNILQSLIKIGTMASKICESKKSHIMMPVHFNNNYLTLIKLKSVLISLNFLNNFN